MLAFIIPVINDPDALGDSKRLITYISNHSYVDFRCLLGRKGRRFVGKTTVPKDIRVPPLVLIGNLLTSPLPLERQCGLIVLAIR